MLNTLRKPAIAVSGYLLLAFLMSACSTTNTVIVPDTEPGDQLKSEYLIGEWCTNREETAQNNKDAGFSPLTNLSKVFWRFSDNGKWGVSRSGFLFDSHGTWRLEGRDMLMLAKFDQSPKPFKAQFKDGGTNLFLIDEKDQFLVLMLCD